MPRAAFAVLFTFIVACSHGVHAQEPCDQSKGAERPYLPANISLPETGQTISAAEIVSRFGFWCKNELRVHADGLTKNVTCCPPIAISETNNFVLAESYVPGAKYCSGGNFIPGLPAEQGWARGVRIVLYGMALGYCFLGVAIIADRFMVAIEVITSKTKEIHVKNEVGSLEPVQVQVWNATISNLTLMALGSSAPEILLAVIETLGTMGKPAVEGLGPSCIVGSAAFNLLVISAICVLAIGNGEVRGIKQFGVFNITAFFSVFAYVWMYIVLMDSYVVAWEAWVTFMMAPLMTGLAYGQDKGWIWCRSKKYKIAHTPSKRALNGEGEFGREQKIHVGDKTTTGTYMSSFQSHQGMNEAMFKEVLEERARELGVAMTDVDPNEVAALCAKKINDKMPKSRAYYRTQANKAITGGNKASKVARVHGDNDHVVITKAEQQHREEASQDSPEEKTCLEAGGSIFNWSSTHTSVFENEKYVQLTILRRGDLSKVAMVKYETSSGSAMAGVDFVHTQGAAKFPPGAAEFVVKVGVIDDNEYEPDENFYCRLYSPSDVHVIGKFPITEVTIINDDDPGQFTFEKEVTVIPETTGTLELWIKRVNGCDGKVELKYKTTSFMDPNNAAATEGKTAEEMGKIAEKPGSGIAVPGIDYKETEGMVVFGHQETRKMISVEIINTKELSKEKAFNISFEIQEFPQCGAKYGDVKLSMVKISADLELSEAMDKVAALLDNNLEAFRVGSNSWAQQFAEAVEMPSAEEFGEGGPGCLDYFTHFATFYWKVLFAFVPPTSYCNGWLTFWMSIVFIGILTGIVGDIAGVFGCLLGISPAMTAITFVALGTSLPDTFASKQAAEEADTADASIGNVTGSNSVNVFLGQGIPWIIATSYRLATTDKSDFEVKAGSLNFSVIVFCSVACVCIFTFYIRRFFFGGELGGPTTCKYISATIMTFLWFLYIVLSYLQSEGIAFV